MSRPAKFWKYGASPFVRRRKNKPETKVEVDWKIATTSDNHQGNDRENREELTQLRLRKAEAERLGKDSAVRRIDRNIRRLMENNLVIQGSSCGNCLRTLRLCRCEDRRVSRSTVYRRRRKEREAVEWIHDLLNGLAREEA